jgi:alkylation response protein AidB-like acyl-CoA dehydrogenase
MSAYTAPIKDMEFAIHELADFSSVAALPGCEDLNAELVRQVLEEAGKFATEVLDPLNRIGDKQGTKLEAGKVKTAQGFANAYRQFVEGGWNGLSAPQEFGGQGLPYLIAIPVAEIWNSANMAFCLCPMLTSSAIEALSNHAEPALAKPYLEKLVEGVWTGTMNLTEPQAGSDLSAVRCRAVPDGDHFRIHGTKIFITWGEHDVAENIVHMVLARTPDAPEGVKGISLFLVPKILPSGERNDVQCASLEHKLGIHASPTAVMAYGEEQGAVGFLVGEENRGLEYMFTMMNHARLGVGVEGLGIAERAYQHALAFAKERLQGRESAGKEQVPIIRHPDVRRMLLAMKSQIEAMRALCYFAASRLDLAKRHPDENERARNQALVDLLIPVVKGWCTETAVEITSLALQVHGGMGYIEEAGAAQYYRDARITTIYEGTTGIQANDLVGRKIVRDKGAAAMALLDEMDSCLRQLSGESELRAIQSALGFGAGALRDATQWLLANDDSKAVLAGAVPYLKLLGIVAGGWEMSRAALLAKQKFESDRKFFRAKIATAEFYAAHVLPLALALKTAVCEGQHSLLGLDESDF